MSEILIHVVGVVLGALALSLLGLNKKTVVVRQEGRVGLFWKAFRLGGKFLFYYGLVVFLSNWAVNGIEAYNTRVGVSMFTFGLIFWIVGAVVISAKRG